MADNTPLLTPGRLADLIESDTFKALPFEQRQTVFERGAAEAHDHITQTSGWTPDLWRQYGEAIDKRRAEIADSKTWTESAMGAARTVGRVLKDSAITAGTMATGLSPILPDGKPGAGVAFQVPGETLVPMLGANIAKLDESIAATRMGGQEVLDQPLNALKAKLKAGDFPLNDAKAFGSWLDEQNAQIQKAAKDYYTRRQSFGQEGVPEEVKAKRLAEVEPWVKANDLSRPENAAALRNFLRTRSDSAWETLRQNLLRTPAEAAIEAQRTKLSTETPLAKALKPEVQSYIQEAADPMELAGTAFGVIKGAKAVAKGESLARRAGELAKGVAGEVLSEQGSLLMDSPNATPEQRWQVAKDSLIGALGLAGAGAIGGKVMERFTAESPSATPADTSTPPVAAETTGTPSPPEVSPPSGSAAGEPSPDGTATDTTGSRKPEVVAPAVPRVDSQGTGGLPAIETSPVSPGSAQGSIARESLDELAPAVNPSQAPIANETAPERQPDNAAAGLPPPLPGAEGEPVAPVSETAAVVENFPEGMPPPSSPVIPDTSPTITGSNAPTGAEMPVPSETTGEGSATAETSTPTAGGPGASSVKEWGTNRFGRRIAKAAAALKGAWAALFRPMQYRKRTEIEWEQASRQFVQQQGLDAADLVFDEDSGLEGSDRVALAGVLLEEADKAAGQGDARANGLAADIADWLSMMGTKFGQAVRAYGYLVKRSPQLIVEQFRRKRNEDLETDFKKMFSGLDPQQIVELLKQMLGDEWRKALGINGVEGRILGSDVGKKAGKEPGEAASKRQKTMQDRADALLDQYARSQSDTLAWQGKKAPDALRALMREHIQNGLPDFIERAQALGVEALTAERLMQVGTEETRRIEGIKTAARLEREALANQTKAAGLVDQLAREFSDTLSPQDKGKQSALAELVARAKKQEVTDLEAKLAALKMQPETSRQLAGLLDEYRRRAAAVEEARQRLAEAEAPEKMAAKRAEDLAREFSDTITNVKKQQPAPVQALMNEAMKRVVPDLEQRLQLLGVSAETAQQVTALIEEGRRRAAAVEEARKRMAEAERPENSARAAVNQLAKQFSDTPSDATTNPDAVRQKIAEALRAEQPIEDLAAQFEALGVQSGTAAQLAKLIDLGRKNAEAVAREKAGQRLMESLLPKVKGAKAKRVLPALLEKLMEAERTGVLGRTEFLERYAEAFGLPKLTPEIIDRITTLAREARELPEGLPKMEKAHELQNELAVFGGVKARDAVMAAWYANLLSGVSTQGVNIWGNGWQLGLRSLAAGMTNVKDAMALYQGMLKYGVKRGLMEAKAALKGQRVMRGTMDKLEDVSALEALARIPWDERTGAQKVATLMTTGPLARYVFRALGAMDGFFHGTAMEGRAHLAASRAVRARGLKPGTAEYWKAIQEDLGLGTETWNDAQARASIEAKELGKDGDWIKRRTWDIIDREQRDMSVRQEAQDWADLLTFRADPQGSGRWMAGGLNWAQSLTVGGVPVLRPVVPFARMPANLLSMSMDLSPIGVLRGWRGKYTFSMGDKASVMADWDARERLALGVVGSVGAGTLGMMAYANKDDDDVDVPFMLYAAGPKSKARKEQMPRGWKPYSMKVGDKYWSYAETPLAPMLTMLGAGMDAMRYHDVKDEDVGERLRYVMSNVQGALFSQGVLSSLGGLFDAIKGDKPMTGILNSYVSGFIPAQGLLRDINTLFDPDKISATDVQTALLKDVPVIRGLVSKPDLNAWGEPVKLDGLPVVRRFVVGQVRDKLSDWMTQNRLNLPALPKTVEWGQFLPGGSEKFAERSNRLEAGLMTASERYRFVQRSRQAVKQRVDAYRKTVEALPDPLPTDVMQRRINAIVEASQRQTMLDMAAGR